ncbi:MAG: cyclic nucleotide-binding domain-containing protein [Hyphomicrobiaceae bacterium]|nr:cyclic nucleotide-binding domain-containing protein [Hyphomicrobiaceae bacterium]
MAIDALLAPLLRVEIFQGLSPLQITEIARRAERIVFKPGSKITVAGKDADAAYLIVGGVADCLSMDDDGLPEAVEEASLIGEMAMLIEHSYGATVLARGNVRCLKILRSEMHEQMLDDPVLADKLSANITARLTRVAQELRAIDRDVAQTNYGHSDNMAQILAH